jgi:hypothetical protein
MANVIIRLVVNKATGKKDVVIGYTSDADALPMEHEDAHRAVVEKLLAGGIVSATELGEVIVSREERGATGAVEGRTDEAEERRAVPKKG